MTCSGTGPASAPSSGRPGRSASSCPSPNALGAAALTAAELRLLALLSTHLTFWEIAEQMFLSRTTIKSQAMSIYRKLGTSRSRAVARSRELGILEG